MTGLKLALGLLRIPRLFASLLLFPLIISCVLIVLQLFLTRLAVGWIVQDANQLTERVEKVRTENFTRQLIYGSGARLGDIKICRWIKVTDDSGEVHEIPPFSECNPNLLDVAIHVKDPLLFEPDSYIKLFNGNFERLHICQNACKPHIVISINNDIIDTKIQSIPALLLLSTAQLDQAIGEDYIKLANTKNSILGNLGKLQLLAKGFDEPIALSSITYETALIVNIATIIIIGLWLALKAHRKVIDYFSDSGALLPMVAAFGKGEFYSALWLITFFRVGVFMLAAIPSTLVFFFLQENEINWDGLFQKDSGHIVVWIIALFSSFTLAALISSIADLKRKHSLFAAAYTYLPLILSFFGSLIWLTTFLMPDTIAPAIRSFTTIVPIISMGPILVAPIFQPSLNILVFNTLITTLLIVILARLNITWFAAHLEEL